MAERVRCEHCNQEFKDNDGLVQHKQAKHQETVHHSSKSSSSPIVSGKKTYLIILAIFAVIFVFWFFKSQPNGNVIVNMTEVIGTGRPELGNPNAPVTIVEFSDFECPYCADFAKQTYPLIKRDYIQTGKVRWIFRNFPLYQSHQNAMQAAEAALCVYEQGNATAYFAYHDKLFANAESLTIENLKSWASDKGYNISSCLDSHSTRLTVLKDMDDANKAGVQGTPSFFINGKFMAGNLPYVEFKKAMDSA